ncbi:hypothetical protein IW262DRAFT_1292888 [Armillaria fumosa]|nr:hypothetical protein IW262DRAFT_1292888 [Armillaria fumosa]
MAYKGSFFVREGPRQAPNDGDDDDNDLLDDNGDHGDGWVIGGLEEVYGMHRHRIRGKEGTKENDRSPGWPEQEVPSRSGYRRPTITTMDEPSGALIDDPTTDQMPPTDPVWPRYHACRWLHPPRPTSPSPAPPRTPRATTSVYLPLFE